MLVVKQQWKSTLNRVVYGCGCIEEVIELALSKKFKALARSGMYFLEVNKYLRMEFVQ